MKRIEVVITPWTLHAFKEAAPRLGIAEFDLVEIYRSGCATTERNRKIYRGRDFTRDLLPRLRIEFVLFDDKLQTILHELLELVRPESIAIFKLDQTISPTKAYSANVTRIEQRTSGRLSDRSRSSDLCRKQSLETHTEDQIVTSRASEMEAMPGITNKIQKFPRRDH